jgi:hypothetical protein
MRIGLDHCVGDVADATGQAVGHGRQRYRRPARSVLLIRHELSTRFVILAGNPGRIPWRTLHRHPCPGPHLTPVDEEREPSGAGLIPGVSVGTEAIAIGRILQPWTTAAEVTGEPALRSFATGLRADQNAVTNCLNLRCQHHCTLASRLLIMNDTAR